MRNFKIMAREVGNLTDARFFASWEVDWLGFNFDPADANYIAPLKAVAIREWVAGPSITGMFGIGNPADIASTLAVIDLDAAMIHMFADPGIQMHFPSGIPLLVEVVADAQMRVAEIEGIMHRWQSKAAYFVFDFLKNDIRWEDIVRGHVLDITSLERLCSDYPVLLAADLNPATVREIAATVKPAGFCLRGGEEEKIGFKSFDELEALLEVIEVI